MSENTLNQNVSVSNRSKKHASDQNANFGKSAPSDKKTSSVNKKISEKSHNANESQHRSKKRDLNPGQESIQKAAPVRSQQHSNKKKRKSAGAENGKDVKNAASETNVPLSETARHRSVQQNTKEIRKRPKKARKKSKSGFSKVLALVLGLIILLLLTTAGISYVRFQKKLNSTEKLEISDSVLQYRDTVEKYAAQYDIEEYVDYLLAIIQVESGGEGSDIMQSSESAGLDVNTYTPEESIAQGCAYFKELLNALNYFECDIDTLLQAYNYGNNFIVYVSENGQKYDFDLSMAYAEEKSNGEKVQYWNIVALRHGMKWRYKYGNMFYVDLIHQYI